MQEEKLKSSIIGHLADCQVIIEGEGCNLTAIVVSDQFLGKNSVKRQQLVYKALQNAIADGELHAITLKTYTLAEWEAEYG